MIRKNALALRDFRPLLIGGTALLFAAAGLFAVSARAQEAVETIAPAYDPAELEELVGPVALYPDDVLGIILPASTFPLQIVQAARFLDDLEADPSLQPDEDWADSVVALLNYPEVLRMMNEDLDWTWALGEAVLTDQSAVLAAAQDFRRRAYAAGNLETDDRQIVTESADAIVIEPADPEVVYIPYYEPREVVVYQRRPVYYYYPVAYPLYYYPYPAGYSFSTGFFFGVTSWFSVGWDSHYLHVHHHSHHLHPYYLNTSYYYRPYYYRNAVHVTVNVNNYVDVWQPSPRRGARPQTATVSGRTSTVRTRQTATIETQPGRPTRQSAAQRTTAGVNTKLAPVRRESSSAGSSSSTGRGAATGQTSTSTRTVETRESRRSTVGQGDRASASNRASGSTAARPVPDTDIVRPSDLAGNNAATRTGSAAATRAAVRPSGISGVSRSQIRSVQTAPLTSTRSAPTTTPNQGAPIARAATRSTTGSATNSTSSSGGSRAVTPRTRTATSAPRTSPSVPRATPSAVRTQSASPRSSVAVPRSSTPSTSTSGSGSSFRAPAAPAPRGTIGTNASSRSSSSSSSSRRR